MSWAMPWAGGVCARALGTVRRPNRCPLAPGLDDCGCADLVCWKAGLGCCWLPCYTVRHASPRCKPCASARPLQPLLEQLLEEFQQRYPGIEFPPIPPKGALDLEQLREAAYFFS
jgi:hypothetical protein